MKRTIFAVLTFAVCSAALAQVSVTERSTANPTSTVARIAIDTWDRSIVPLIQERRETKVDPATTRTDSVAKARGVDGTYFDWQRESTVTRRTAPNMTTTATDVTETDRQGATRATRHIDETVTTQGANESARKDEYRRNASGQMVLDRQVTVNATRNSDGSVRSVRVEKAAGVSGNLVPEREIDETIVTRGPGERQIDRTIKTVSHIDGQWAVTGRESSTVRTESKSERTETVSEIRTTDGWKTVGQSTTAETRAADGTVQREIIERGVPLYEKFTSFPTEPLAPKRRIVESEVRRPDGSTMIRRDVYRRDVNGEWKPEAFSADVDAKSRY